MKIKALYQMSVEELREQERLYVNGTQHIDRFMLTRVREALAAKSVAQ